LVSIAPAFVDAGRDESEGRCALVTVVDPDGVATLDEGTAAAMVRPLAVSAAAFAEGALCGRVAPGEVPTEPTGAVVPGVGCVEVLAPVAEAEVDVSPAGLSPERHESRTSTRNSGAVAERGER
jgi:hypothetical protein